MILKLKRLITLSLLLFPLLITAQTVSHVYKIDALLKRISSPDTTYIVNFWATWCKPCVQELPSFDSLYISLKEKPVKLLLVTLDFKEELNKKVNPFLAKNKIKMECVLLDEVNGNDFIDKVDKAWTGAIPATLFKKDKKKILAEKKMHLSELEEHLKEIEK